MKWKSIKEVPNDYKKFMSLEFVDGNIKSVSFKLPKKDVIRIRRPDNYSDTLRLEIPEPPEKIEQYVVVIDDKRSVFEQEEAARQFAELNATTYYSEEVFVDKEVSVDKNDDDILF